MELNNTCRKITNGESLLMLWNNPNNYPSRAKDIEWQLC